MALGMLGKYERLDVLGHGASGIVYLAKDTLLGRLVALKEISAEGEDKTRFLEEARVLDRLRHPNIVEIYDVSEYNGKVLLAMEYVKGRNLQDVLRETPKLPIADALQIVAQICDGLGYAHAHRTVHRDVKPANVLVTREGQVKLVDFGLAEVLGTHSVAGGAGTYAYMAPEDFHEQEHSDRQSDIWAVGIILYEMLAGRRPFQVAKPKDPFAWKRAVETDPIPDIFSLRPDAPPGILFVLGQALARDKRERYADIAQMSAAIRALNQTAAFVSAGITGWGIASDWVSGFPDIDAFLAAAPDEWAAAREALTNGSLERWLTSIGEEPLAAVAAEVACEPARADDDKLRDFLYRAGIDLTPEAKRAYQEGTVLLRNGQFEPSVTLLRRAVCLDPARPAYHQELAHALRAAGNSTGAALALEEGLSYHPAERALAKEHADLTGARLELSASEVNFGILRQGQPRAARIVVRNAGSGLLEGRVASAPAWVRVEPGSFSTRQRQPLLLTADTKLLRNAPAAYQEKVVLETSAGRQEIGVSVQVIPARRTFGQIALWYLPVLFCCLAPALAGMIAPTFGPRFGTLGRHLWEPGFVASGLLSGALFALTVAAETSWGPRLLSLAAVALTAFGAAGLGHDLHQYAGQAARIALVQTSPPAVVLLLLMAAAFLRDPRGLGRWQIWRWIVSATGLLLASALLRAGS